MKRTILALAAVCTLLSAHAQKYVRFNTSYGWREIPYSEFAGLTFLSESTPDPYQQEPVDLGLSVKWSSTDFGSEIKYWRTITGGSGAPFATSPDFQLDESNNLMPAYDIVHKTWGGCWRMPTLAEWEELRTQCTWEISKANSNLIIVTGKNGNSITLAISPTKFTPASSDDRGYWTSTYLPARGGAVSVNNLSSLIQNNPDIVNMYPGNDQIAHQGYFGIYYTDVNTTMMVRPVCDDTPTGFAEEKIIGRTITDANGIVYLATSDSTATAIDGRSCKGDVYMPDYVSCKGRQLRVTAMGMNTNMRRPSENGLSYTYHTFVFENAPITSLRYSAGISNIEPLTGCNQLTTVTLPDSLRWLHFYCLSVCPQLKRINLSGAVPPYVNGYTTIVNLSYDTGKPVITDRYANFIANFKKRGGTISYPTSAAKAYQNSLPWALFEVNGEVSTTYEVWLYSIFDDVLKLPARDGMALFHGEFYEDNYTTRDSIYVYNMATGEIYHTLPPIYYKAEFHKNGVAQPGKRITQPNIKEFFAMVPSRNLIDRADALDNVAYIADENMVGNRNVFGKLEQAANCNIYNWTLSDERYTGAYWYAWTCGDKLTRLVPTDDAYLNVPDPISFFSQKPRIIDYTYKPSASFPIGTTLRALGTLDGTTWQNNGRVGNKIAGSTIDNTEIINRLSDIIMREHTIVGDIHNGNEYFRTLGGTVVRYKDGKFQGTLDMYYEQKGITPEFGREANVLEHKTMCGNEWHVIDHVLVQDYRGAYEVLSQTPECSEFFNMCMSLPDEIHEALSGDEEFMRMNVEKQKVLINRYVPFVNTTGATMSLQFVTGCDYTLFVPNNEAMAKAKAEGRLNTWQQKVNFIQYHLCFGSEYADRLPFAARKHTTVMLNDKLAAQQVTVSSAGNGEMTVTDRTGATHKVVKPNLFTYEALCTRKPNTTMQGITTTNITAGVVHVIDSALRYE